MVKNTVRKESCVENVLTLSNATAETMFNIELILEMKETSNQNYCSEFHAQLNAL